MRAAPGRLPRWAPLVAFAVIAPLYLLAPPAPALGPDEAREANVLCGYEPFPWVGRPPLYAAAEMGMARLFGPHEAALRALPGLAALLAIGVTYRLARRVGSRGGAILAAGLLALSGPFLAASREVSPAALDALAAAALVHLYARFRLERTAPRLAAYAAAAALALLLSLPAMLVVLALAVYEAVAERLSAARLWRFAVALAPVVAVAIALASTCYAGEGHRSMLVAYFSDPYTPSRVPARLPWWTLRESARMVAAQSGAATGWPAVALAAVGSFAVWRPARVIAAAFALLLFVNVAANAFELYPFGATRPSVYLAPIVALLVAAGAVHVFVRGRIGAAVAIVALLAAFGPAAPRAAARLRAGSAGGGIRALVAEAAAGARPGDGIYVAQDAVPAFEFYWREHGRAYPPEGFLIGGRFRDDPAEHAPEVDRLAASPRAWSLLAGEPPEESGAFVSLMERRFVHAGASRVPGARLDRWTKEGG